MNKVGKLLIANPTMPEGHFFSKSVVYIYADNDTQGTVGIVLNKKSTTTVQAICHDNLAIYNDTSNMIHVGGPVNRQAIVMLHTNDWTSQNTTVAGNGLNISSDQLMFLKLAEGNEPAWWRMCMGMSVWAPGQLDMEIKGQFPYHTAHQWLTAEPNEDIIFGYDGEEQWNKALELCSHQIINQWF